MLDDEFSRGRLFEDDGVQQSVLVPEHLVDCRKGASCPLDQWLDDLAQGRALEALLDKKAPRSVDNRPLSTIQAAEFGHVGHICESLALRVAGQGCNRYYTFAPAQ